MLAIAKSSSSGDVAERSHTPPAPALRAEKSSTAASCRGGRSPASTSTGGLHRGTVAATGPAASGSESMCTQRCGQRGARHLRWRGATRRLVTSVGLVDLHNDNPIGPRPRPSSALRGAGGRLRPPPWDGRSRRACPRTKPGNTTKLGSSYETEQGRNGKITDVLSHDGLMHVMIASEPSGLCLVTCHRAPATRPATHAGHARSTC